MSPSSLSFVVPTELAPAIIGQRGSMVRRLVDESLANSIVLGMNDPSVPERRVSIHGEADALRRAFDGVCEVLRAECARLCRPDATRRLTLLVPKAESLVGAAPLTELRRSSGAAVELSAEPCAQATGDMERVLRVSGDAAQVSRAVQAVVGSICARHQRRLSGFFKKWCALNCTIS